MRRSLPWSLLFAAIAVPLRGQAPPASPPLDSATLSAAHALLLTMHSDSTMLTVMQAAMDQQRQAGNPNIPPLFYDRVMARVHDAIPTLLVSLDSIYARHYSREDLVQLAAWYHTPLGQRVARETGPIGTESAEIGRRWGASLAMKVMSEMIDKGEFDPRP